MRAPRRLFSVRRFWDYLLAAPAGKPAARARLGMEPLEAREVPAVVLYDDKFSAAPALAAGVTPVWTNSAVGTSPSGEKFRGEYGNQTVSLTLSGLPAHDGLTAEFDVYLIRSWDGNDPSYSGPAGDRWSFKADGTTQIDTTFRNPRVGATETSTQKQNYASGNLIQAGRAGTNTSGKDADGLNTLGYHLTTASGWVGNTTYHFSIPLTHTGSSVTLSFAGAGLQGLSDESWGIDNLKVTANPVSTQTSLEATPASTVFGQPATFTANVTSASPTGGVPTGSVTFFDGLSFMETVPLVGGVASYTTPSLAVGNHAIRAVYNPTTWFQESEGTVDQTVSALRLESLTFLTDHPGIVGDPDESGDYDPYSGPQFLDLNRDGDVVDPGDQSHPTSFTRDGYLTVSLLLRTAPLGVSTSVWVRGEASNGMTFSAIQASISPSGELSLDGIQSAETFGHAVEAYLAFSTSWEYTFDPSGQAGWTAAGTTTNELYVTLARPTATILYHSLIWSAATAAAGQTTEDVTDCVFADYQDLNVSDANGNRLYYYKQWLAALASRTAAKLLATKDGNCTAWCEYFVEQLRSIGSQVPEKPYSTITPTVGTGFLMQSAEVYDASLISPGDPGYPAVNDIPNNYPYWNSFKTYLDKPYNNNGFIWGEDSYTQMQVIDGVGLPGQGTSNPLPLFNNHVVVKINGKYYDPSYGKIYTSLQEFEDQIAFFVTDPIRIILPASTGLPADQRTRYAYFFRDNPAGLQVVASESANSNGT